ncbi:MAG: hypothetical protein LBO78_02755 [Rickettsiales bacterium]|jgi:hypothetical protein|nr:hypothetical protein [Rickettsiales bacterium]
MLQKDDMTVADLGAGWKEIPEGEFDVWVRGPQSVVKAYTKDTGADVNARLQLDLNRVEYLKRGTYLKRPLDDKDYMAVNLLQGFGRAAANNLVDIYTAAKEGVENVADLLGEDDPRDRQYARKLEKARANLYLAPHWDEVKSYIDRQFKDTKSARLRDRLSELEKQNARMKASISKGLGIQQDDENFMTDLGGGFWQLGKSLALNVGLGGMGAIAFYAAEKYPRYYTERRLAGQSAGNSSGVALAAAAVDGFLERWGSEIFLKHLSERMFWSRLAKAGLGEAIEELEQAPAQALFMNDVRGQSWGDVFKEGVYSASIAAITGAVGGAAAGGERTAYRRDTAALGGAGYNVGQSAAIIDRARQAGAELGAGAEAGVKAGAFAARSDPSESGREKFVADLKKAGMPEKTASAVAKIAYDFSNFDEEFREEGARALNEQVDPVKFPDADYSKVVPLARDAYQREARDWDVRRDVRESISGIDGKRADGIAALIQANLNAEAEALGTTPRALWEREKLRFEFVNDNAPDISAAGASDATGTYRQSAAMYRNPRQSIGEFVDYVQANPDAKKSFMQYRTAGGVELDLPSDTVKHDVRRHNLTKKQWGGILENLDNVEDWRVGPRKADGGMPLFLKIDVDGKKYGVQADLMRTGRIVINTAFPETGTKGIEAWMKKGRGAGLPSADSDDSGFTGTSPAAAAVAGHPLSQIISEVSGNVKAQKPVDVNSPAFKRWFGDSVFKDRGDNPIRFYHGTGAEFSEFSEDRQGRRGNHYGYGFYFTDSYGEAEDFARNGLKPMEVYLSASNPFYMGSKDVGVFKNVFGKWMLENRGEQAVDEILGKVRENGIAYGIDYYFHRYSPFAQYNYMQELIQDAGYDAIVNAESAEDIKDIAGNDDREALIISVFEPTQIKSAVSNTGDFDPDNPNIYYSREDTDGSVLFEREEILESDGIAFPKFKDLAEARSTALDYYKKNLRGTVLERQGLGPVRFSNAGIKETNHRGSVESLRFLPAVREIIMTGTIGAEQELRHARKDGIVAFVPVRKAVSLEGKTHVVEVLLGKDGKGNLYYNLNERGNRPVDRGNSPASDGIYYQNIQNQEGDVNIKVSGEVSGNVNSEDTDARGSVRGLYDRTERLIRVFENGDVDTIIHELVGHHFTLSRIRHAIDSGNTESLRPLMEYYQVDDASELMSTRIQEDLAKNAITYFKTSEAPTPGLRQYFEQFREWLAQIWDTLVSKRLVERSALAPEVSEFFDSLFSEGAGQNPGSGKMVANLVSELKRVRAEKSRIARLAESAGTEADYLKKRMRDWKGEMRERSERIAAGKVRAYEELKERLRESEERLSLMRKTLYNEALKAADGDAEIQAQLFKRINAVKTFRSMSEIMEDIWNRREQVVSRMIYRANMETIDKLVRSTKPYASNMGKMDYTSNMMARELRELNKLPKYRKAEKFREFVKKNPYVEEFLKGEARPDVDAWDMFRAQYLLYASGGWGAVSKLPEIQMEYPLASESGMEELYDRAADLSRYPSPEMGENLIERLKEFIAQGKSLKNADDTKHALEIREKIASLKKSVGARKTSFASRTLNNWSGDWNSYLVMLFGKKAADEYDMAVELNRARDRANASVDEYAVDAGVRAYGLKSKADFIGKMEENSRPVTTAVSRYRSEDGKVSEYKYEDKDALTKNQIIYLWLQYRNEKTAESMDATYGKEQLARLFSYLAPADMEFGMSLAAGAQSWYDQVNPVYVQVFGMDMPRLSGFYFPRRSEHTPTDLDLLGFFADPSDPSMLKRRNHFVFVKPTDAFQVMKSHAAASAYMAEAGLKYREIREIFGSSELQKAVKSKFGDAALSQFKKLVTGQSLMGNRKVQDGFSSTISRMVGNFSLAKIGLNPSVFFKQLVSVTNYSVDVADGSFTRRLISNIFSLRETLDFFKSEPELARFVEQRFNSGFNDITSRVLSDAGSSHAGLKYGWSRAMSALTRAGDILPIMAGGRAMIEYQVENGVPMADAVRNFERSTLRSQQSGNAATMSLFQQNRHGVTAALTAFTTTPMQYLRKMNDAYVMYMNGEISTAEFAKIEGNYVFLQAALAYFAGLLWKSIRDWGNDDDEELVSLSALLQEIVLTPFKGLPFVNDVMGAFYAALSGERRMQSPSILGLSDFYAAAMKLSKVIANGEVELEDAVRMLEPFIEAATAAPVGTVRRTVKGVFNLQ